MISVEVLRLASILEGIGTSLFKTQIGGSTNHCILQARIQLPQWNILRSKAGKMHS